LKRTTTNVNTYEINIAICSTQCWLLAEWYMCNLLFISCT